MTDPQTKSIDERLAIAARAANRRREIGDRLLNLGFRAGKFRDAYLAVLDEAQQAPYKVPEAVWLWFYDRWQRVENEIIALHKELSTLIPEIRENEEV